MGAKNRFRSADGSGNNIFLPEKGQAKTPYARNVTRTHPEQVNPPDPGTVFDLLLCRDKFVQQPAGISSLLFSMANTIIHDLFSTDHVDPAINLHSSYLDLQVVYGTNEEEQNRIRTGNRGYIKNDVISDWRLSMMPPATTAWVIMFSRSHNYIAKRLLEIDERNRFDGMTEQEKDDELFGLARLVNCGMFVQIILRDYIPTILNQTASDWFLDPLKTYQDVGTLGKLPRGGGNVVSAEFSVLYRWHSAASAADEQWMAQLFNEKWPDMSPQDITPEIFFSTLTQEGEYYRSMDPSEWELHGWKRDDDGKFDDRVLGKILKDATVEIAGAIKARGSPVYFRAIEILGMIQAREGWALSTLNEFRSFLGLKTYSSFSEWNNDPEVAKAAEMLYGHIDNLELYPGMHAEQTKDPMPGSGLCPGFTISRGILSDAASLVRGDRFFTDDFSTSNLTTYGYEFATLPQPGSHGLAGKLLFCGLPGQYTHNSIYALYPFSVPKKTIEVLAKKGILQNYDVEYPQPMAKWYTIRSFATCKDILDNPNCFSTEPKVSYDEGVMLDALMSTPNWKETLAAFYNKHANFYINETSIRYSTPGNTTIFDMIDVCNCVTAQFTASMFAVPIREMNANIGTTAQELHAMLSRPLAYQLAGAFTFMTRHMFRLEDLAETATKRLMTLIKTRIASFIGIFGPVLTILQGVSNVLGGPDNIKASELAQNFYKQVFKFASHKSYDHLAHDLVQMMISFTAIQSLVMVQLMDYLLREENETQFQALQKLAPLSDPSSMSEFRSLLFDCIHQSCDLPPPARKAVTTVSLPNGKGGQFHLQEGDGVYIPPEAFYKDPTTYKGVPGETLPPLGLGDSPTQILLETALPALAKEILKLPKLRAAPGGIPKRVSDNAPAEGEKVYSYVSISGQENPLPIHTTFRLLYEANPVNGPRFG
ncbi:heme peroxidase [Violaceomyces palustris]|uniref:Heme peroxidase n=1 Tax=Violaceomyces palustris TaxID=1673888 RepID=A0ACD0NYW8_9BASI|nr:heme peroxidase [Violaceomyces palustris]